MTNQPPTDEEAAQLLQQPPVQPVNIPEMPFKVAFVIDGEVVDILHTDERLAAIFLSNPTIVDATEQFSQGVAIGWNYDGSAFTPKPE